MNDLSPSMLRVVGSRRRRGGHVSRRQILQTGVLGLAGLALPNDLRSATAAQSSTAGLPGFGRAKRCLVLYIYGAWSQLDTFDPKPALAASHLCRISSRVCRLSRSIWHWPGSMLFTSLISPFAVR